MLLCFVKCFVPKKPSYQEQKACLSANRVSHHAIDNQVLCQLTKQFVTRYFPLTLWLLKLLRVHSWPLLHANHTISRSFYSFFLLLHIPWNSSKLSSSSIFKGWPPFKKNCGCSMFITHPLKLPTATFWNLYFLLRDPFGTGASLCLQKRPSDLN